MLYDWRLASSTDDDPRYAFVVAVPNPETIQPAALNPLTFMLKPLKPHSSPLKYLPLNPQRVRALTVGPPLPAHSGSKYLTLRTNEIVTVLKRNHAGWWLGLYEGKIGWFPARYCVEIEGDAAEAPAGISV